MCLSLWAAIDSDLLGVILNRDVPNCLVRRVGYCWVEIARLPERHIYARTLFPRGVRFAGTSVTG